jgi:hypothetical protein
MQSSLTEFAMPPQPIDPDGAARRTRAGRAIGVKFAPPERPSVRFAGRRSA